MSSFKKVSSQKPIPGTRTSLQNGQTITSSGNPSLDHILGGGIPIGSVVLIEEDKFVTYSRVLTKYFLAEGICSNHSILLGSLDEDVIELSKKLPKPTEEPSSSSDTQSNPLVTDAVDDKLNGKFDEIRIAWRYRNLPKVNSEQTTRIGHNFNLLEQIDPDTIQRSDITYWQYDEISEKDSSINDNVIFHNPKYYSFLDKFSDVVESEKFYTENTSQDEDKSILRVCLTSLGSPLWWFENDFNQDFIKFLRILKSIVRNRLCVGFITIPMHLMELLDVNLPHRIRNLFDFSIELESFAGSDKETNPAFKEYNGLLNIHKLTALNCLMVFKPETTDLAFKLRRKKFVIEKLHLPPELQDSEQREQDDIVPSLSCGSSQKHLLEF